MQFEDKIIANVLFDNEYALKIIPYTKSDYFEGDYKPIIDVITKFYIQYGTIPSKDEIKIEINNLKGLTDKQVVNIDSLIDQYQRDVTTDRKWLIDTTEKFYQKRSLTNAIINSASILEKDKENTNEILKLVQDALAVSFDSNLGHNYFEDINKRFEEYHTKEDKLPTGMAFFDRITLGGFSRKSLNCVIASSGSGKTLCMISLACNMLRQGFNVLYVTLEMSETRISERFDANLLDIDIPKLGDMSLQSYTDRVNSIKQSVRGNLIVKEWPTGTINSNHIRAYLEELKIKRGFIPDFVVVDYINLMNSSRYKAGLVNSYSMVKAVSEELRGLAVENNLVMLTATQTNRNGMGSSDIEQTDIADSIGLVFTLDMMFALIRTEALDAAGQIVIKQLKNRYCDLTREPTITCRLNRDRMMISDLESDPYKVKDPVAFAPQRKISGSHIDPVQPAFNKKPTPKNDFSDFTF